MTPKKKAIEIKTTEEISVMDYTIVARKKWVSYDDYKEQQKRIDKLKRLFNKMQDNYQPVIQKNIEQQKQIDDLKKFVLDSLDLARGRRSGILCREYNFTRIEELKAKLKEKELTNKQAEAYMNFHFFRN